MDDGAQKTQAETGHVAMKGASRSPGQSAATAMLARLKVTRTHSCCTFVEGGCAPALSGAQGHTQRAESRMANSRYFSESASNSSRRVAQGFSAPVPRKASLSGDPATA